MGLTGPGTLMVAVLAATSRPPPSAPAAPPGTVPTGRSSATRPAVTARPTVDGLSPHPVAPVGNAERQTTLRSG